MSLRFPNVFSPTPLTPLSFPRLAGSFFCPTMSTLNELRAKDTGTWAPNVPVKKFIGCAFGPGYTRFLVEDLDLDTDGADHPSVKRWEEYHQAQTSLDPSGKTVCSVTLNYGVLPKWIADRFGLVMGQVFAVLDPDETACFGILADYGPAHKIGEGSIALHRALGHETVRANGTIRDESLGRKIRLVFLSPVLTKSATNKQIESVGRAALAKMLGDHK